MLSKKFGGLKLEIIGSFCHNERKLASSVARNSLNLHLPDGVKNWVCIGDACSKFSLLKSQLKGTTNPFTFYTILMRIPSYWFPLRQDREYLNSKLNFETVAWYFMYNTTHKMEEICAHIFSELYSTVPSSCCIRLIADGCRSEFKSNLFLKMALVEDYDFDFVGSVAHHMSVLEGGCDAAHWQLRRSIQSIFDLESQQVSLKNNSDLFDFCQKNLQGLHGNLFYKFTFLNFDNYILPDIDSFKKFKLISQQTDLDIETSKRENLSDRIHRLEAYNHVQIENGLLKACPFYKFEDNSVDTWTLKNLL